MEAPRGEQHPQLLTALHDGECSTFDLMMTEGEWCPRIRALVPAWTSSVMRDTILHITKALANLAQAAGVGAIVALCTLATIRTTETMRGGEASCYPFALCCILLCGNGCSGWWDVSDLYHVAAVLVVLLVVASALIFRPSISLRSQGNGEVSGSHRVQPAGLRGSGGAPLGGKIGTGQPHAWAACAWEQTRVFRQERSGVVVTTFIFNLPRSLPGSLKGSLLSTA